MSQTPNPRGDLVIETASKQDFGWFEERLTLTPGGSLKVQSGYGDADNGDTSWYTVEPENGEPDVQKAVNWPESLHELFCNPGVDQSQDLTELLGVPVRLHKHE